MVQRVRLIIRGRVQGVGFRPTLYRYATATQLVGFAANTSNGVVAEVQGHGVNIEEFLCRLVDNPPPLARIDTLTQSDLPVQSAEEGFEIQVSTAADDTYGRGAADPGDPSFALPPDLSTCEQCRQEIFDPKNKRYYYPFTSCTDCGPRFTLAESQPKPN
ncbi:MAG: carbamoyltransferase HypF, partial [Candidatus Electrothrix sp. ATG2]|nr:carbamoyltransferase HypF [Candidatus Electrothrix sp. ATG2]